MNEVSADFARTTSGMVINKDNVRLEQIRARREDQRRMDKLESAVSGIANSIAVILDNMQRNDQSKIRA